MPNRVLIVLFNLILFIHLSLSTSVDRLRPLSHLSPVNRISIDTENHTVSSNDHFTLTVEIPSNNHLHNLRRRWWAISDPNEELAFESESLFTYLTRNDSSSLEVPEDFLQFKLVLEPNVALTTRKLSVVTSDEDGNIVPHPDFIDPKTPRAFKGIAYRRLAFISATGNTLYRHKPVGWARIVVHEDGDDPIVEGAWKVDDEEGLGVPSSVYHLDRIDAMEQTLGNKYDEEYTLLNHITSKLVVWRDFDMRLSSTFTLSNEKEKDFTHLSRQKRKRNLDLYQESYSEDLDTFLYPRATNDSSSTSDNNNNDTGGNSGFSSGANLQNSIGDTNGCPSPREIALMGIAADCNFLAGFNTTSDANSHIINIVNTASHAFENAFNITLGLSQVYMVNASQGCPQDAGTGKDAWNFNCSSSQSSTIGNRLSLFSQWRGQRSNDGLATWSLLTSCAQGSIVGISWLGMACVPTATESGNSTFTAGTNVISRTSLDWRVLAHELGHSYGAVHDCDTDTCAQNLDATSQCCPLSSSSCDAGARFLMNPVASESQDSFSACSQGNVCGALGRNSVNSTCLTSNTGVKLVTNNECGNGIVEEGEECDCGGPQGCGNNTCCDPLTCKFTTNSQCDDSNESCCQNCKFATTSTVCRASQGPCDPPEFCTGNSSSCPGNILSPNGDKCDMPGLTGLTCISGHCTSRDQQCITLLGNSSVTADGSVLNVTKACSDDSSCQLSCVDPRFGSTCFTTSQNFLDGTPCRGSGQCQRGRCVGGSSSPFTPTFVNPFGEGWLQRHQNIIIGVAVGIGVLFLACILYGAVKKHFAVRRRITANKNAAKHQHQQQQPPRQAFYQPSYYQPMYPPPPPPPAPQQYQGPPAYTPPDDYELQHLNLPRPPPTIRTNHY